MNIHNCSRQQQSHTAGVLKVWTWATPLLDTTNGGDTQESTAILK